MTDYVLTAGSILTMDSTKPRGEAVAVSGERIVAVGSTDECLAALPGAEVRDSGVAVMMPGFIDSHSHPVLSGMATMPPGSYIGPWVAPTWDAVLAIFQKVIDETPAGTALSFFGYDGLLQSHEAPTAASLDAIFGDRLVLVFGNSGHTAYVSSAVLRALDWVDNPPADPAGGSYGRLPDGSLDGSATEVPACLTIAHPVLAALPGKPLHGAVEYYAYMSRAGITSTSERTHQSVLKPAYEALADPPSSPLRVALHHISTETGAGWQRFRDAFDAGVHPSFPQRRQRLAADALLNVQTAVPRLNSSGAVHGPDQASTQVDHASFEKLRAMGSPACCHRTSHAEHVPPH